MKRVTRIVGSYQKMVMDRSDSSDGEDSAVVAVSGDGAAVVSGSLSGPGAADREFIWHAIRDGECVFSFKSCRMSCFECVDNRQFSCLRLPFLLRC